MDNPGDSKIPLDLVFLLREGIDRTGERTPTGAGRTRRSSPTFGSAGGADGPGPRGAAVPVGARSHSSAVPGGRATGHRGGGATNGPGRGSTPTAPEVDDRRRQRWHGQPGQRERRRGPTGRATDTEVRAPATGIGRPIRPGRGRLRHRATGGGAVGQRVPGNRQTGLRLRRRGLGDRPSWSGRRLRSGDRRQASNGTGPARPDDRRQTGIARRAFGHDGRCDWSRRRLTPEDRPVVDRSTFGLAPGGCAGASRQHRPGPLSFSRRLRWRPATRPRRTLVAS